MHRLVDKMRPRITTTRLLVTVGLVFFTLTSARPAPAYDKDTHYGLTYYLARKVGYTVSQAWTIASAAWSVDLADDSKPVRLNDLNPLSQVQGQAIRAKFHALPESSDEWTYAWTQGKGVFSVDQAHYSKTVKDRQNMWRGRALSDGNPGIYLHYLQDTYAHNSFLSATGHILPAPTGPMDPLNFLPLGGVKQDFIDNNLSAAKAMASATVKALQDFMEKYGEQNGWDQSPCNPGNVDAVVTELGDANPSSRLSEPNWDNAKKKLEIDLHDTIPEEHHFEYDSDGNLKVRSQYADFKVPPPNPAELIASRSNWYGYWCYNGEKDGVEQRLCAKVDVLSAYKPWRIAFTGGKGNKWEDDGVYDETHKQWNLSRKPSFDQIPTHVTGSNVEIPNWVREQVQGKLEWHLVLKVEKCGLTATFYPGLIKWNERTKKAWVPEGKEGWGSPRTFTYSYYGTGLNYRVAK